MTKPVVVLGVCGGIAAYKAAGLCSLLGKEGYDVQVLMTEHATRFVQPLTFQSLSKHPVVVDTFLEPNPAEIAHIAIADRADYYVIAPATANVIAKLALGLADDMVTTTALATTAPIIVAPAMNVHMFSHRTVREHIEKLRTRGVIVLEPGSGPLACGYVGKGRMPEPLDIADVLFALATKSHDLVGESIVVTAGPTVEDIDPVRFLSNSSSGRMGYAIAAAAVNRGATVTLVSGPTHLPPVVGAKMISVRSTGEMLEAVQKVVTDADILVSAAAPADFRPKEKYGFKWKKSMGIPVLELESTPDVLATVSQQKTGQQIFVGFAAETENEIQNGTDKLTRKGLDMLVVNNVTEVGSGFGVDTNRVVFLYPDAGPEPMPLMSKDGVANELLTRILGIKSGKCDGGEG
jgi:phosphopantothenoylcysteine decarboxylase / phosphopantothenate---cysteine ligase